jgi:predicted permease
MGFREWIQRLWRTLRPRSNDGELEEELRLHLELAREERQARGLAPGDAQRLARLECGGVTQALEAMRDQRVLPWIENWAADLRYALRTLRGNPGFAALAVLVLAIGIGANTAMFSLIDGVLLRPLPFRNPDRLFAVTERVLGMQGSSPDLPVSALHFREWRKRWSAAEQLSMLSVFAADLTTGGDPQKINMGRVSSNFFSMLGVAPHLGRDFLPEEDQPGRDQVAILADSLWRSRFHAEPSIVGQKILIDDVPYEVIGVLPPGLVLPKVSELQGMRFGDLNPDVWKPFAVRDQELASMGDFNFGCLARLNPGVFAEQALAELNSIQSAIVNQFVHEKIDLRASVVPLQAQITGRSREGLLLVMSAVAVVLLIACVNVANLLLARSAARRRELTIRAAMGASAARLLRQMLTESFVLAGIGGAFGIAIAYEALNMILAAAPIDLPRLNVIHIDVRVLAMALALTIGSALLFGLFPALLESRSNPQEALRASGLSSTGGRDATSVRSALVTAEVALSTLCLIAAGLLLASFVKLMHVDRGFEVERINTLDLSFPAARYPDLAHRADFLKKLLDNVGAFPGVTGAAVTNILPLAAQGSNNRLYVDGVELPVSLRPIADFRIISERYFHTMGIPMRAGRTFEQNDRERRVAILSSETADRLWPGQNPIGRHFRLGDSTAPLLEVVGVAGGVRGDSLQQSPPLTVYLPYWQRNQSRYSLSVHTAIDPAQISSAVRAEIRKLDPEIPVPAFRTMREIVSASVAQREFQLTLVLLFGAIGLMLASLGIYGVVSYSVEQRRGEMGIRMALGATARGLGAMVLREGLKPVAAGLAIGIAAGIGTRRLIQGFLFGVRVFDPWTIAGVALVLLGVAAAACYVPVRRVTRADPLNALRYE